MCINISAGQNCALCLPGLKKNSGVKINLMHLPSVDSYRELSCLCPDIIIMNVKGDEL